MVTQQIVLLSGRGAVVPDADNTHIVPDYEKSLHQSPADIGPAGTVPQTAQNKDNEYIDHRAAPAFAASAKGNVDIPDEEAGQRHVPSLPQLLDRCGLIRRIEVDGKCDAQHQRKAGSHITVAAEIKIDFKGIGQHDQNHRKGVKVVGLLESVVHGKRKCICQKYFFGQADNEQYAASGKAVRAETALFFIMKL